MVFVYKCILSDAEMVDDQLIIEEDFNGYVLKVKSEMVVDQDSEEEEKVNNVTHFFNYTKTEMKKNQFLTFMKKYVKAILDKMVEEKESEDVISEFKK